MPGSRGARRGGGGGVLRAFKNLRLKDASTREKAPASTREKAPTVRGESRGYTQSAAMCNVELRAHTLSCPACIHLHTLAPHLHTTLFLKHVLSATE
eukprot:5680982-Prymnesium_polylepis.1